MSPVFIIAECGSNWRFAHIHSHPAPSDCKCELQNAYRMIRAAKSCGSDGVKFQFTTNGAAMADRRGMSVEAGEAYSRWLTFPHDWLPLLADECHRVGVLFGCTVFLPSDVGVVHRHVDFVKVSAFEANDKELRKEWRAHRVARRMFVSVGEVTSGKHCYDDFEAKMLHCVSKYPTPIEELGLMKLRPQEDSIMGLYIPFEGISDHSANVLTGAVAVGSGVCEVIESHVRLHDTPRECPDYGHSTVMYDNDFQPRFDMPWYKLYVENIRTAERMM